MTSGWTHRNLETQGYCLTAEQRARLRVGLRFPTGLCLPLVAAGVALESVPLLAAMAGVAVLAGFTPRHPFDLIWNHGVRHLSGAPELPPNPRRRRHAFKLGAAWLAAVSALFAAGLDTLALVLALSLLAACALVTAVNFCVPSTMLMWLERRLRREPLGAGV